MSRTFVVLICCLTSISCRSDAEKLPPPLLEVILLCDVEEMKYREIATVLEIPIGTVMSRIARARTALRRELQVNVTPREFRA